MINKACLNKASLWLLSMLLLSLMSGCGSLSKSSEVSLAEQKLASLGSDQLKSDQLNQCPEQGVDESTKDETAGESSAFVWPTPACPKAEVKKCPVCAMATVANKLVLGEYELVVVEPPGFAFPGRIDTGATSTSLHASEITPFERDGRKWVRFKVNNPDGGEAVTLERKRVRKVRIKQTEDLVEHRLIVMLTLRLGRLERQVEVSLTDRSNMEFPLLVGRNFLLDAAVVDVSLRRTVN